MSVLGALPKQPGETIRITVDWSSKFLSTDDSEQVSAVSIAVSPTTDTPLEVAEVNAPPYGVGYFLVSGGEDGQEYYITFTATTTLDQVIESEVVVTVEEISQ